jgi:hypothetical protein
MVGTRMGEAVATQAVATQAVGAQAAGAQAVGAQAPLSSWQWSTGNKRPEGSGGLRVRVV